MFFLIRDRVRLGEYDTQTEIDCVKDDCAEPVQEILVDTSYPHPGFSDSNVNRKDDIAVIRLTKRARYSGKSLVGNRFLQTYFSNMEKYVFLSTFSSFNIRTF